MQQLERACAGPSERTSCNSNSVLCTGLVHRFQLNAGVHFGSCSQNSFDLKLQVHPVLVHLTLGVHLLWRILLRNGAPSTRWMTHDDVVSAF